MIKKYYDTDFIEFFKQRSKHIFKKEFITIKKIKHTKNVIDETDKYLVLANIPLGFILCSNTYSPDLVYMSSMKANLAKNLLPDYLAEAISTPLELSRINGLSYQISTYLRPLSKNKLVFYLQKIILSKFIISWLQDIIKYTINMDSNKIKIQNHIQHILSLNHKYSYIDNAANEALYKLDSGEWIPYNAIMHGDFWHGNILLKKWPSPFRKNNFQVIDWAGCSIEGYPVYDLIRFSMSFRLPDVILKKELIKLSQTLNCTVKETSYYLIAALGKIGCNLENFPKDRYLSLIKDCSKTLFRVIHN